MRIGVPKETAEGERRVALVPEVVGKLVSSSAAGEVAPAIEVVVERGAGAGALIPDQAYADAGAELVDDAASALGADVVVKVAAPNEQEVAQLGSDATLIGFLGPLTNGEGVRALAEAGVTSFAMEAIPRISRAQSMDALSSQANISGYRSALIGAQELGRFYPMLMTAAGTIRPATVLVLGAGVAGLQAIATARRLGAVVQGFDVRSAVKEQVESLGANFLEFDLGGDLEGAGGYAKELTAEQQARQQELMAEAIGKVDVVITTALVPGRRAPILVTEDAVKLMKPGSVIVDLAGEAGGNCEVSEPGESVIRHDVKILAPLNVPSTMAEHASQLYARNIQALLGLMVNDAGELSLDFEDEVIAGACITRGGEIVHEGAKAAAAAA
ncbi:MAG TPA: Re/Si-specific NAD(P)(+) transhydrogenase subunit alpha [Solirubrobacteraceae bacterium]|jgi:NAD(P) transhydrogenase subunit alpha|nr:Re/Si-specific NAD(P)(+) transhydrogenase subunit alpha [Solirubrobacteraceae bacterium]